MASALLLRDVTQMPVASDCPHENTTTTRVTSRGKVVIVTRCDDCKELIHQSSMQAVALAAVRQRGSQVGGWHGDA